MNEVYIFRSELSNETHGNMLRYFKYRIIFFCQVPRIRIFRYDIVFQQSKNKFNITEVLSDFMVLPYLKLHRQRKELRMTVGRHAMRV